jgi:hypothetical protein
LIVGLPWCGALGRPFLATTMLQAAFNWLRLQYYRYTVCTGLYMLGNVEVTIIHLIFAVSSYYLLVYAHAFITQLTQLGTPSP